jgi:signal transduction histidine kinase
MWHEIDSLKIEIRKFDAHKMELGTKATPLMDSTKANLLYEIIIGFYGPNADSAIFYAKQCKDLSEKIGYKKGVGNAYNGLGLAYAVNERNLPLALECYQKALKIRTEINDEEGLAWTYNNLGLLYSGQGDYQEAINNHTKSLLHRAETGNKAEISETYRKRGRVYQIMGDYPEALKNYLNGLKFANESGFIYGIEGSYRDIAGVYEKEGNNYEALKNYIESSKLIEKIEKNNGIANTYSIAGKISFLQGDTIDALEKYKEALKICDSVAQGYALVQINADLGNIYFYQNNYDEALKHFYAALKMSEQQKDKFNITNLLNQIGEVYLRQSNYPKALSYIQKALRIALETRQKDAEKDAYKNLSEIYINLKDFKTAYRYNTLYHKIKDTLQNAENASKLKEMGMQFDFDKESALQKVEQDKKNVITQLEIQKQKNIQFRILAGVIVLIVVLFYLINRYRKKQSQRVLEMSQRISRDLHDEIGSSLSSVQIMSSFASESLHGTSPDAKQWMNRISDNTKDSIEKIRDIVWTLNSSSDISGNIIIKMNQFNSHTLEPKEIACNFIADENINEALTDFVCKRNVYLIFKEAVNNIAKYSEATEVNITIKLENKKLVLTIEDNGKGFDMANATTGNGLNNMQKRAIQIKAILEIKSSKNQGTVISLKMPIPHLRYGLFKKA